MRTEARHRLKEDPFAEGTREIFDWFMDHRVNVIGGIVVAGIIIAAYLGWWRYQQTHDQQASIELGQAVRTMNAPLGPAALPGQESYPNAAARAQAAEKKFADVAAHYGHTLSGRMAAYYVGVARVNAGNNPGAEQQFKKVASSGDKDIASLARLALASLYLDTGRDDQAISICKDLVAHPTATVTRPQAQLELAAAYQARQPQEAMKIYQQLEGEDPSSPLASIAMQRMSALIKR